VEWNLFAATHEELEREIFQRKLLHVKVHKDAMFMGGFKHWGQRGLQASERSSEVDWIGARKERRDLDRNICAGDRAEVIAFQQCIGCPCGNFAGQNFNEVEIFVAIHLSLAVAQTRFAEQVDTERHIASPEFLECWKGALGIPTSDELARHRLDLP